MNLIFWQNCISPHQLPYIKELHHDKRVDKVILIAPIVNSSERILMGWDQNNIQIDGVTILIAPRRDVVIEIFKNNVENSIHLFSGIRGDRSVYEYFKLSLTFKIIRGIITEPPFDYKKPLFLHKIRFLLFDYKYIPKIDYVFGMGDRAVNYYKSWSKKWKVILFGYCVDNLSQGCNSGFVNPSEMIKFVYVGSLIKLKNVILLLKAINRLPQKSKFELDIIGDGQERDTLKCYVQKNGIAAVVNFLGRLPMTQVHEKMDEYDVLLMPSIRDGWGAVINEALQKGLFIVSSDNCGAKTLFEDSDRGKTFKNRNLKSLTKSLEYCLQNEKEIREGRISRIDWSEKITGKAMAKYMVDCFFNEETITPPWKN